MSETEIGKRRGQNQYPATTTMTSEQSSCTGDMLNVAFVRTSRNMKADIALKNLSDLDEKRQVGKSASPRAILAKSPSRNLYGSITVTQGANSRKNNAYLTSSKPDKKLGIPDISLRATVELDGVRVSLIPETPADRRGTFLSHVDSNTLVDSNQILSTKEP